MIAKIVGYKSITTKMGKNLILLHLCHECDSTVTGASVFTQFVDPEKIENIIEIGTKVTLNYDFQGHLVNIS